MRISIVGLMAALMCICVSATPATAQRTPLVQASGDLSVQQSFMFDLDNGAVGSGPRADIWFHAVSSTERYLEPQGATLLAAGDGSDRGFAGCAIAQYTATRIALANVPIGSFVCVRTGEGRISQFRRTAGVAQDRLTLRFTTWALNPFP